MNFNCTICSDLIEPFANIYSTTCGHLFHHACLIQWIERSKTCPQCRHKTTEKSIHKLFFNLQSASNSEEDVVTLHAQIDNYKFQITLKDKDIKNTAEEMKKVKGQLEVLREDLKKADKKRCEAVYERDTYQSQIHLLKHTVKENEKLHAEIDKYKRNISTMRTLEAMVHGSKEDVDDMLTLNHTQSDLCLMVSTLKKQLIESDHQKKKIQNRERHLASDMLKANSNLDLLKDQVKELRKKLTEHENCEKERRYLKRKIEELASESSSSASSPNNSIKRIIHESPAPLRASLDTAGVVELTESPSVEELVQQTEDSNSPYLNLKSTSVGLQNLMRTKFTIGAKYTRTASAAQSRPALSLIPGKGSIDASLEIIRTDYCYNGLGDRNKVDLYPTPQRPTVKGMKRHTSATITSTKFRKLSSQVNRK